MNELQIEAAKGIFIIWLKSNQLKYEDIYFHTSIDGKETTFSVK